jgi:hypothetical protein
MLKRFLEDNEYKPTTADPSLYYKREQDDLTLIGVYVDDIVVAGTKENVKSFYNLLKSEFTVRDFGEVKYHLGIQFHRESDGSIFLYQQKFVVEVLERFKSHLENKRQVDIPMKLLTRGINDPTQPRREDEEKLDTERYPYNELIGCLMYLVVCTRPDLSLATSILSRHLKDPAMRHFEAGIHILQNLIGTSHYGIYFDSQADPTVVGYSDAAESNHPRLLAQTGVVVKRFGGPIIFYSHRQKLTKLSIADSEMVALNDLVGDLLHVGNIHDEVTLPIKRPIQAWTDNEALSKRVNNLMRIGTYSEETTSAKTK